MISKPKWGERLPLKTEKSSTRKDMLENGLAKWKKVEENEN